MAGETLSRAEASRPAAVERVESARLVLAEFDESNASNEMLDTASKIKALDPAFPAAANDALRTEFAGFVIDQARGTIDPQALPMTATYSLASALEAMKKSEPPAAIRAASGSQSQGSGGAVP